MMTRALIVSAISYAIGCISGAYYIMRLVRGADIRALGTGTAGAHNVLRVGGTSAAAGTFVIDTAKGALAVVTARALIDAEWAGALALLFVVVGHIWPAQLGFRGGKGLTAALGAMLAADPRATLIAAAAGVVSGAVARSVTVGALATVAFVIPSVVITGASVPAAVLAAVTMLLILWAHHPSFGRLRPPVAPAPGGST